MNDAERIWREKSDEELLDAAAELDDFTDDGQRIIRAELKRRGLEDPVEQAGGPADGQEPTEPLECLRCSTPLRLVDPGSGRVPRVEAFAQLYAYACPRCGHVELFTDVAEEEEETGDTPE